MLETGHEPRSLPNSIIFASMFNEMTHWESQNVHNTCLAQANEVAFYDGKF